MADSARKDAARANERVAKLEAEQKEFRSLLDDVKGRLDDRPPEEEAAFADAQSRADAMFVALGEGSAPRPTSSETLIGYRARMLRKIQKHSPLYKDEDLLALARTSPGVFAIAETAIYADANTASRTPLGVEGGGLRQRKTRDDAGREIIDWFGDPLVWMQPMMSGAKAVTRLGRE